MSLDEAKARILDCVRSHVLGRSEPVVALGELSRAPSLGDIEGLDRAVRELILSGELRALMAGGGVFLSPASPGEKRRRTALLGLTKHVLVELGGRGDPLEELVDAMRVVDALEA